VVLQVQMYVWMHEFGLNGYCCVHSSSWCDAFAGDIGALKAQRVQAAQQLMCDFPC
jgi:hypothetical protein